MAMIDHDRSIFNAIERSIDKSIATTIDRSIDRSIDPSIHTSIHPSTDIEILESNKYYWDKTYIDEVSIFENF